MTKHQHYIPRMILKRWGYWRVPMSNQFEYEGKKKKKKIKVVYRNTINNFEELKDIRDICYVDWLHEYKKDGKVVDFNVIENHFGYLENIWNGIIDKIEKKLSLTDKEVIWLKILIIKQLMRTPEAIIVMTETLQRLSPITMSQEDADRYYKISAFAMGIQVEAQWAFWSYFKYYAGHPKLAIFHTNDNFILCDERPVLCLHWFEGIKPTMYLPVSPQYMLGLIYDASFENKNEDDVNRNYEYIDFTLNDTQWFNDMIYKCGTHIIANNFEFKGE